MNNYCSFYIKQIDNGIEKLSNKSMRAHKLTNMQISIILTLEKEPKHQCTLKTLEKSHHVAQSTMAGIITRLEQKGLIESFTSLSDKRVKIIRLTDDGVLCCKSSRSRIELFENQILNNFTDEEKTEFRRLLEKSAKNFENKRILDMLAL